MPAGLARMHVHDIVTTDERARQDRQGHPRGRKGGRVSLSAECAVLFCGERVLVRVVCVEMRSVQARA